MITPIDIQQPFLTEEQASLITRTYGLSGTPFTKDEHDLADLVSQLDLDSLVFVGAPGVGKTSPLGPWPSHCLTELNGIPSDPFYRASAPAMLPAPTSTETLADVFAHRRRA